jgi:hypothetical protein
MRRIVMAVVTATVISGGLTVLAAAPAAASDKIWSEPAAADSVRITLPGNRDM